MDRPAPPSEEEQFQAYRRVAEAMAGRMVYIRTADIGGDKPLPYLDLPPEDNPFLGLRGLRLSLARPDMFKAQLRAILRAAAHGNLAIMLPMVTEVGEIRAAKVEIDAARRELLREGRTVPPVPVGIMVEVPAAALAADQLAAEVDFFSIGTNDLTQYTLAVDRGNEAVARLYRSDHPAVLALITSVVRAGAERGIPVSVCGEMAGDPELAATLVRLGVRELSMSPGRLNLVKQAILTLEV